jgi:hypothetical protein
MRPFLKTLAFLLLCPAAWAGDASFKRVWPEWFDADTFQSYHEDQTGRELAGKWTVIRTQPGKRGGLYFVTRIENVGLPIEGANIVLHVVAPDSPDARTFTFPAEVPNGGRLFELGLTGADWKGEHVQPVAWAIELHGPDGALLARKTSFLWELPAR